MNNQFEFLIYKSADEDVSVNAVIKEETIWLTQKAMAELFNVEVPAISKHLSNFNLYEDVFNPRLRRKIIHGIAQF